MGTCPKSQRVSMRADISNLGFQTFEALLCLLPQAPGERHQRLEAEDTRGQHWKAGAAGTLAAWPHVHQVTSLGGAAFSVPSRCPESKVRSGRELGLTQLVTRGAVPCHF